MAASKLERLLRTDKQKRFEHDFLKDTEKLECWEDVVVGEEYDSEQTFEVTRDDLVMFAEASLDSNPLFYDEQAAQASTYGRLLPHPIFLVEIAFWCIGKGRGNWLRTPGAMNPGQHIVWYDPLHVGDIITMKQKTHDKWIRRQHCYITNELNFFDQRHVKKATWWAMLILPRTRGDIRRFARA